MRFRPSNFLFWAFIIIDVICVFFSFLMLRSYINEPRDTFSIIFLMIVFIFPVILMFLLGRQVLSLIVIDDRGIRLRLYGRNIAHIPWAEMAEVGIGSHFDQGFLYNWVYFARRRLSAEESQRMPDVKQTNEIMKVRFTKRVLRAVQKYYQGEIKNLDERVKNVNTLRSRYRA